MKVAAAQLAPVFHDRARSVAKACDAVREAARQGAALVAFPECFIPGYPYFAMLQAPTEINPLLQELHREAIVLGDASTRELCAAAKQSGVYIVMGLNQKEGGTLYNAQLFIGPDGTVLGCRRKLVPTSHERLVWGRGDGSDLDVYRTEQGVLGGLICYEHANALFRYAVQAQGEEVHVAAWPGGMPSLNGIIDAAVRHYAFEAQAFVISVTSVLTREALNGMGAWAEKLSPGGGSSCIVSPRGDLLAGPVPDDETLLYAELDFALITKMKTIVDSVGHYARPDVVRLLLDRRAKKPLVEEG